MEVVHFSDFFILIFVQLSVQILQNIQLDPWLGSVLVILKTLKYFKELVPPLIY